MFYVEPLLLLALVIWLDKGLPRPPRLTAAAVVAPAALLLSLPFERLFNLSLLADTPGLIPLIEGRGPPGGGDRRREGPARARRSRQPGLFFALVPRRWGVVLAPIGIALFLVFSSVTVLRAWAGQSRATHASQGTNDLSWIDKTIGPDADAAFLLTPDFLADPHPLWQSEFWNRSVRRVFLLDASDPNGYPAIPTTLNRAGRLVTAPGTRQPKYVVTAPGVNIDGTLCWRARLAWPVPGLVAAAAGRSLFGHHRRRLDRGGCDLHALQPGCQGRAGQPLASRIACRRPVAYGSSSSPRARPPSIGPGSRAAARKRRSASGLPRLRSRCGSTSSRPSRRQSSGSPTHASSECWQRSGRCPGDEQGANAARQGPPPDQANLLDGRGARSDRRALGRRRARAGRE